MAKAHFASCASDRLRVVLVATRNPLNIGAAARAMGNFGFRQLRVVNPYEPAFREAQSAVDASDLLRKSEECKSVAEAVADCTLVVGTTTGRQREVHHPLRPLKEGADLIRKRLQSGAVALLFGSEKRGLSNEDLSHCHWLMRIPTREQQPSMNLGQAVAVCLYELIRETKISTKAVRQRAASGAEVERATAILLDALRASGFLKPAAPSEIRVRQFVRRLNLSAEDAELWLGMLRQMIWKMQG